MSVLELLRLALSRLRTHPTPRGADDARGHHRRRVGHRARRRRPGRATNITARLNESRDEPPDVSRHAGSTRTARPPLDLEDADAIGELASVAGVAPEVSTSATVTAGDESTDTTVVGTTTAYPSVRAYDIWQGSFLTDVAVERALRVAVLGSTTADDLGLGAEDVGSRSDRWSAVRARRHLQPKGGAGGADPDDQVLVPVNVVQKYFVGGDDVRIHRCERRGRGRDGRGERRDHRAASGTPRAGAADDDDFTSSTRRSCWRRRRRSAAR